jgi:hypothetical protein
MSALLSGFDASVSFERAGAVHSSISVLISERMRGASWRNDPQCPAFDDLRYLQIPHWRFDGTFVVGEMVVHSSVVVPTMTLFARLWAIGFPIAQMQLIDNFAADDDASMAANNCSAFNFRTVAGTSQLSLHSLGIAIDINPIQNPWQGPRGVAPSAGNEYLDRTTVRPGMFVRPGPIVAVFDELGWEWGGDWRHAFDYHHIVWRG